MGQWEACCLSSSTVRKYLYRNRQDSRLPSRSFIWRKSWERHGLLSRVNGAHSASLYMSRRRFLWMRSFLRLYDFPQVIVADYVEQDSAELDPQLVLLGCGVRFRCSLFFPAGCLRLTCLHRKADRPGSRPILFLLHSAQFVHNQGRTYPVLLAVA